MPNTNTLTNVIPQLLAQGLLALRQQAIMPRLVNRAYDKEAGEKGSVIQVPIASSITATAVTASNTPPDDAGVSPTKVDINLDKWYEAPFFLNDKEMQEAMDGVIPLQASSAVKALANQVDNDILALYKKVYGFAGTAGTTPFAADTSAFATAKKNLRNQLSAMDPLFCVINADAEANVTQLRAFQSAADSGSTEVIVNGQIGRKLGALWAVDQNIPTHTAGTITTGLIAKAATVVAAGLKTFVATTAASTGAIALKTGDIISIAGHTQTYTLTADATEASAATDEALAFEPGLQYALAGSEAITVQSSHAVNLLFHRDAFALATRPFAGADPMGIGKFMSAVDPVSGLTLRLEVSRQHKRTRFAYDILYGVACPRPEYASRIAG